MFKVIQINLNRCRAAHDLLEQTIRKWEIDIVLASEPNKKRAAGNEWTTNADKSTAIRLSNTGRSKNKRITQEGWGSSFNWVTIDNNFTLFSVYLSPNLDQENLENMLHELGQAIRNTKGNIAIGGDFNGKAHAWGSAKEDRKGTTIAEWDSSIDLHVCNEGATPTFERGTSASILDLTFVTNDTLNNITNWKVEEEETLSDHKYITFELQASPLLEAARTPRQTKWLMDASKTAKFLETLEELWKKSETPSSPATVTQLVKLACDKTFKKKRWGNSDKRPVYWWNDNIAALRKECLRARREMTRIRGDDGNAQSERARKQKTLRDKRGTLKKAIIKAKNKAWSEVCREVENDIWGRGFKIVTGKISKRKSENLSDEEQLKIARTLFPKHSKITWPTIETRKDTIPEVTITEVKQAGKQLRNKKAPGPDGIPPEIIKAITDEKPEIVTKMLDQLLREGSFPREWKKGRLVLVEKPKTNGKRGYRPLCLLNSMAKLFEIIVNKRLLTEIEEKGGFSERQFGFRKHHSTIDALDYVKKLAEESNRKRPREFAVLVLLDIKNAFGTVPWEGIAKQLESKSILPYLRRMINSYLSERTIFIGKNSYINMTCGVPQGSVIGPTLWNTYYDEVLKLEPLEQVTTIAYADDLAIVVRGRSEAIIKDRIKTEMYKINNWLITAGLELATHKTEIVVIAGRNTLKNIEVRVEDTMIRSVENAKYLGLNIGRNMNWTNHIQLTAAKAEKLMNSLSRLLPNKGGAKETKRRILAEVAYSILLYGASIWTEGRNTKTNMRKLETVQRKGCLRIACAYRTVPTCALQVISSSVPIHLLCAERTYGRGRNTPTEKFARREATLLKWQEEWEAETTKGQWTKRLIPDIRKWINRKHGSVGFHLSQFLSGHGCFGAYLKRMNLADSDECRQCGNVDTAEHAILMCNRWSKDREEMEKQLDTTLTVDNVVPLMLKEERNWTMLEDLVKKIILGREEIGQRAIRSEEEHRVP